MVSSQLLRAVAGIATGIATAGLAALAGKKLLEDAEHKMALQRAFERFHERIRHEQFGERDLLRERRETLQARLRATLNPVLRPRLFSQGSYALQTGVKPISGGGFDLDLGLVLQCRRKDVDGPIEAKQSVLGALRQGRFVPLPKACTW